MSPGTCPRGLLLEAMGTLIGLRPSVGSTYAALASRHGLTVEAAAIDRAFPRIYRQAPPLAFPGLSDQALEEAEPALPTPDSPTQRVLGRVLEGFEPVRHADPMLRIRTATDPTDAAHRPSQVRVRPQLGLGPEDSQIAPTVRL